MGSSCLLTYKIYSIELFHAACKVKALEHAAQLLGHVLGIARFGAVEDKGAAVHDDDDAGGRQNAAGMMVVKISKILRGRHQVR
jgi:hypothetical protein